MASNASRSPSPPSTSPRRRTRGCARRCERACCAIATYFPLAFVYSLTTWACYVDAGIGFHKKRPDEVLGYAQKIPSVVGVVLYILLNASYTKAVITDPGSPIDSTPSQKRGKYSVLPTSEPTHDLNDVQTITVSSSGSARYCKKCHVSKPDRSHHCSTCKRCVLKMDHHCPWLATCLGLHNYKAFILFLIYTSLFCWAAFYNSAQWVYAEIFDSSNTYLDQLEPVNVIMLSVLSGIIGLVITGFTAWHLYLCIRGQTTIECLEKTRYLSGVRKVVEQNRQERLSHSNEENEGITGNLKRARDNILEFHANAVPGAFRFEEGEEHRSPTPSVHRFNQPQQQETDSRRNHQTIASSSTNSSTFSDTPAQRALRSTFNAHESRREHDRYEEYLDEQETSGLPNAFDLGWKKNLYHLFGPNILLWWLPVCNTTGDGWRWEVSPKWMEAQEEVARRKEERLRNAQSQQNNNSHGQTSSTYQTQLRGGGHYHPDNNDYNNHNYYTQDHSPNYNYNHNDPTSTYANSAMSLQTLHYPKSGRQMRREFDTTGDDGEIASFEVSGSEADEEDIGNGEELNTRDNDIETGRYQGRGGSERPPISNRDESWGRDW